METLKNIIGMACLATCFGCTGTAKTIIPSKNYLTEKHDISYIKAISTSSSIDIVYHQTDGKPYAKVYASDNLMPYIMLEHSNGKFTAYYKEKLVIKGETRCRIDVYAPSVTNFATYASGDISIPKGLKSDKTVNFQTNASGDIECSSVLCGKLNTAIYGSGDIELKDATCQNASLKVNASGDLNIESIECKGSCNTAIYGSGDIGIKDATCQNASLKVNASGDLSIESIECKESCNTAIYGSGDISISGYSPKASYSNNASGDIDADGLKADEVNAQVYGSGNISCHASKSITAQSHGSGNLEYCGNPSQVRTEGKNVYEK